MAPDPPTTCAEFFRAADDAGYSLESARWALCVAVRRALGFRDDIFPLREEDVINPNRVLARLVSEVTDADPRLALLFDVIADQGPHHALLADAWSELTRRCE